MALFLHNTLTRAREAFEPANPADPKRVTMYVCGPTVYNFAHIGNARPPVVFDVLQRLLRRSYTLTYARNVTDVDDKINDAVKREGVPIGVLTARYLAAFHEDLRKLGVAPPDVEPRVTEHIPSIVGFIERLIAAGHAYAAEGHVLFAVPSFADYGRLSGRDPEDMLAGARVEIAPYKRDAGDFVLWKPSAEDIVGWPSPWGRGRPGWHIECSAMAEAHLGETIDIHGGGVDLLFPHHENELAQSTCGHGGKTFARYWLHNGLVQFDGGKMSKSLGNVRLARDLVDEHGGETVRLALLTAHYRQPLEWSDQLVVEAKQKLDRMYGALREAGISGDLPHAPAAPPPAGVIAALEDDLNTPEALAELFGLVRAANRATDPAEKRALAESLRAGAWLLGLLAAEPQTWFAGDGSAGGDDAEIDSLVKQRDALRRAKNFAEADRIRRELIASSRNAASSSRTQLEAPVGGGRVEPGPRRSSPTARPDPPLPIDLVAVAWAPVPLRAHLLEVRGRSLGAVRRPPRSVVGRQAARPLPPVGPLGVRSGTGRGQAAGFGRLSSWIESYSTSSAARSRARRSSCCRSKSSSP
jgi:cysteinyl-tRNA synthetase